MRAQDAGSPPSCLTGGCYNSTRLATPSPEAGSYHPRRTLTDQGATDLARYLGPNGSPCVDDISEGATRESRCPCRRWSSSEATTLGGPERYDQHPPGAVRLARRAASREGPDPAPREPPARAVWSHERLAASLLCQPARVSERRWSHGKEVALETGHTHARGRRASVVLLLSRSPIAVGGRKVRLAWSAIEPRLPGMSPRSHSSLREGVILLVVGTGIWVSDRAG